MCKRGDFDRYTSCELRRVSKRSGYEVKQPTLVPKTAEFFL